MFSLIRQKKSGQTWLNQLKTSKLFYLILTSGLILSTLTGTISTTGLQKVQASNNEVFTATNHTVTDVHGFLNYWHTHGGLAMFGLPISEEQQEINPDDKKTYYTQWFERAVFEAHPENQPPYDILLRRLGALIHGPAAGPALPLDIGPNHQYFMTTQHNLSGVFLDYWQQNGGLSSLGYPLDEPHPEVNYSDGQTYTVQWFERVRLEEHKNLSAPYNVLLGLLGTQLYYSSKPQPTPTPAQPTPTPLAPGGSCTAGTVPGTPN